jgi:hypothetical protein
MAKIQDKEEGVSPDVCEYAKNKANRDGMKSLLIIFIKSLSKADKMGK